MISPKGISVVLAVLNEEDNIRTLLLEFDKITRMENGVPEIRELIFVDDGSSDRTIEILEDEQLRQHPFQIKTIKRATKSGTLDAQVTGSRAASGEFVLIMDSDLQHPISSVKEMVSLSKDGHELVVASRYVPGGRNNWSPKRGIISRAAIFLSHVLLPETRNVRDPISGFFICRKELISELIPMKGYYKILLYVLATSGLKPHEMPITFSGRKNGESKVVSKNVDFATKYIVELITYMKVRSAHRTREVRRKMHLSMKFGK